MDILPSLLESDLLHTISLTLLHFLWQGLLIAAILLCVKKLISNKHSELRYLVSLLCLTLCVIAPTITFLIISLPEQASVMAPSAASSDISSVTMQDDTISNLYVSDFTPLIAVVWMFGVALLSIKLGWQMLQVHRLTTTNIVAPSDKLEHVFNQLKLQLAVAKRTRLVISLTAQVPMAIGWLKPVVLLPANLASGLTIAQLEMLMAHELAHIKRYDYLVNLIQTFVELVLFFHPAVKWISKQIRIEREYCCDDIALNHCGNHLHYARALTEAEVLRQNIPELAMAATGGDLKSRIHRAVGQHSCAPRYGNQWLAALAAVLVIPSIFTASKVIAMTQSEPVATPLPENQHVMVLDAKVSQTEKAIPAQLTKDKKVTSVDSEAKIEQNLAAMPNESNIDNKAIVAKEVITESKIATAEKTSSEQLSLPHAQPVVTTPVIEKQPNTEKTIEVASSNGKSSLKVAEEKAVVFPQEKKRETTQQANKNTRAFDQSNALNSQSVENTSSNTQKTSTTDLVYTPVEKTPFTDAKLVKSVMPAYPRVFSNLQGQEDISVTFTVSTQGRVKNIEFESGVNIRFKRTITDALKKWRFEPAIKGTSKVETQKRKVFSFNDPNQYLRPVTGSRIARRIR